MENQTEKRKSSKQIIPLRPFHGLTKGQTLSNSSESITIMRIIDPEAGVILYLGPTGSIAAVPMSQTKLGEPAKDS